MEDTTHRRGQPPDSTDSIVISEPWQVEEYLRRLGGLSSTVLREAVWAGVSERASCTTLDPPSAEGYETWRWPVRVIRESLLPGGHWRVFNDRGLPLTVHPALRIAVAVMTGTAATGNPARTPRTKNERGERTTAFLDVNRKHQQQRLFDAQEPQAIPTPAGNERDTWVLLLYPTPTGARCELSLPSAMDDKLRLCEWRVRLMLEPVSLERQPTSQHDDEITDESYEVEVARR